MYLWAIFKDLEQEPVTVQSHRQGKDKYQPLKYVCY